MTKEERKLWYEFLKSLPVTVNRQKVFGNYVADLYISERNTVIELDGSQHYEESEIVKDSVRDEYFKANGITVLRYPNNAVNEDFATVCCDILNRIEIK